MIIFYIKSGYRSNNNKYAPNKKGKCLWNSFLLHLAYFLVIIIGVTDHLLLKLQCVKFRSIQNYLQKCVYNFHNFTF